MINTRIVKTLYWKSFTSFRSSKAIIDNSKIIQIPWYDPNFLVGREPSINFT